uniref:Uncharacterized protein n=1 Tax=Rhizophagus irregularis (strain DAOM 181602 / DAOM 197198 / MUCL 43194) TaxID=747089 RepID=U9UBJ3_RHIID
MILAVAGFQIQMIPSRWYVDDQKSKDAGATTLFVSQESIVGLARQATQLAVEHDSHGEIIGWLKKFIDKHKEIEIAQNQDLMEVQVNNNKENEPLQVENPLDIIAQGARIGNISIFVLILCLDLFFDNSLNDMLCLQKPFTFIECI